MHSAAFLLVSHELICYSGCAASHVLILNRVVERLDQTQENLQASAESLREEVKAKMASVSEAISAREGELLTQVERIEKTKKTQLSEQVGLLSMAWGLRVPEHLLDSLP